MENHSQIEVSKANFAVFKPQINLEELVDVRTSSPEIKIRNSPKKSKIFL